MKSRYISIVILLVLGHVLTESHTFIYWIWPESKEYYVDDWFIKPSFRVDQISILWYSKMVEDSFMLIALVFAGACQAYARNYKTYLEWQRFSIRLYLIWCIYFAYHVFDMWSFLYNYKTANGVYVAVLCLCTITAIFIGFYKPSKNIFDKMK